MQQIDKKDLQILRVLQANAGMSMADVAERCALSKTAVWRRVRDLEEKGVIRGRVTLLDADALGFGLTIFALVRTNQHSDEWFSKFERAVSSIPEILDFHRTSGNIDYLLRVVAKDMSHYDEVYKRLIREVDFADVNSTFVMETFKSDTSLPI